jgi:hypothetical protein
MKPDSEVSGPRKSGKSETLIKAVTDKAAKPSVFIPTQEESPES